MRSTQKIKCGEFEDLTRDMPPTLEEHQAWGVVFTWETPDFVVIRHQPDIGQSEFWKMQKENKNGKT